MLLILPIAHKYCMENLETYMVKELKNDTSYDGYINLIVASRIVGSNELYEAGLKGLTSSAIAPSMAQAKRIGVEATHIVMMAVITRRDGNHAAALAARDAAHAKAMAGNRYL